MKGGVDSEEIYTQSTWGFWSSAEVQLGFVGINLLDPVAGGAATLTADAERITSVGGTLLSKDANDLLIIDAQINYDPSLHKRPRDLDAAFEEEETLYSIEAPCVNPAPHRRSATARR